MSKATSSLNDGGRNVVGFRKILKQYDTGKGSSLVTEGVNTIMVNKSSRKGQALWNSRPIERVE